MVSGGQRWPCDMECMWAGGGYDRHAICEVGEKELGKKKKWKRTFAFTFWFMQRR